MAAVIGQNTIISFGSATMTTRYRSADREETVELVDKSSGADTHKSYLAALKESNFAMEFLRDGTAAWAACAPGTEGTLTYNPEGTAAGKPKYTAVAIVESRGESNPYNDLLTMTVSWQLQAAFTEGTN